jgi:uncharacterized protein YbjT (DUF2867 family)
MKIVVMGGNGLIGAKVVRKLQDRGHEALAASPSSGVDVLTGKGLSEILQGAQAVVDLTNSPLFDDAAVLTFFETSARNLLPAEAAAGVGHHVALSIVGADGIPDSGYMRAKVAQEKAIKAAKTPYTIVRATQFFEYIHGIADASTEGNAVRLSSVLMQPVAADDVAEIIIGAVMAPPRNGTVELAGPERFRLDELARRLLQAEHDQRTVTTDASAGYFGAKVNDQSLVPSGDSLIGNTYFGSWLDQKQGNEISRSAKNGLLQ